MMKRVESVLAEFCLSRLAMAAVGYGAGSLGYMAAVGPRVVGHRLGGRRRAARFG